MSNLKNTYGFSSSLLDTIRSIHETSNQQIDEISTGKVVHTRTGANGVEYHIREDSPTDYSIHIKLPNGKIKHIDTYSSLQRAKSVLDNEVKEEYEQIDELKSSTYGNYIKSALPDAMINYSDSIRSLNQNAEARRKYQNRLKGINTATDKLTKEENESKVESLDEQQSLVPFITQLAALFRWLISSGAIRRFTKEETEVKELLTIIEELEK